MCGLSPLLYLKRAGRGNGVVVTHRHLGHVEVEGSVMPETTTGHFRTHNYSQQSDIYYSAFQRSLEATCINATQKKCQFIHSLVQLHIGNIIFLI